MTGIEPFETVKNGFGKSGPNLPTVRLHVNADGVGTFQGKRTGVVKQLKEKFAPRVAGIHCMVSQVHCHSVI